MITYQNIIDWSKQHRNGLSGARQTRIFNENIEASIVGGARGLYGDFIDDFELAIIDLETNEFVTKFFIPELNDDVAAYMKSENLVDLLNQLFGKGFQVR